jgi:malonate decarboxylase beta subunit
LSGHPILAAAQEGVFMGGAVGEVHGAKLVGLLERALVTKPEAVILLLETGGVRLHEANAGLVAVSEIMHAVLAVRTAGIPVIVLDGGQFGCFGGMGIVTALCDAVVMSEEGRLGLSGPEVIEASRGVEEFDSRDRALVWRTVGGKHRYLLGEATRLVEDSLPAFREAAIALLGTRPVFGLEDLEAEHARLRGRLERFGDCRESIEIWTRLGIEDPQSLPLLETQAFLAQVGGKRG